jgi:hypothetical protein
VDSDCDDGPEDGGGDLDDLNRRQLTANAEVVFTNGARISEQQRHSRKRFVDTLS